MDLDSLERNILRIESVLVFLTIASIATADFLAGPQMSLGPLYLIPISYSALSHRLPTTLTLIVLCVVLRQIFGPLGNAADPWMAFLRDLAIASIFVVVVVLLRRLGDQRRRIFELARRQRDELAREVDLGANVQKRLLAMNEPPKGDFDIAAHTEPLRGVNGDYYDFFDLGERRSGIVIADVAGKGLPAAILMPALRFAARALVDGKGDLAAQIGQLNDEFARATETQHYGTLVYARFDPDTSRITYVNGGHCPPIMVRADGRVEELDVGGPPIGLLQESAYEIGQTTLDPGSTLLLYTDGVSEAVDANDEELGSERLASFVVERREASAREIVDSIFEGLRGFRGDVAANDDTTVIAIKRPL